MSRAIVDILLAIDSSKSFKKNKKKRFRLDFLSLLVIQVFFKVGERERLLLLEGTTKKKIRKERRGEMGWPSRHKKVILLFLPEMCGNVPTLKEIYIYQEDSGIRS